MAVEFDADPRGHSNIRLYLIGLGTLIVVAVLLVALMAKVNGKFDEVMKATAVLADVGDGLPNNSDVKYRGVLVGSVTGLEPGEAGGMNHVDLALDPAYAHNIPRTVTARVVPSNVFAVSSIQLIDNGAAPPLSEGATINQDESASTIQLQTAMTKLREIIAASARVGTDETVGILAAVAEATDRHGAEISDAGAALDRITKELDAIVGPGGGPSTLSSLNGAVQGLNESAPELLDVMHSAVVPMKTLAEKNRGLNDLLAGASTTLTTVNTALVNNTDTIIGITWQLSPVLGVLADGGSSFTQITTSLANISDKWFEEFWPVGAKNGAGKFLFQFTPHRMFTRADCPRYGELEGASCQTAPAGDGISVIPSRNGAQNFMSAPMGGNVGSVGSAQEQDVLGKIIGEEPSAASTLLLGPVARGTTVDVAAADGGPQS
ncbi:MlaD family protein [Nocardia sp. 348MFTsu5.1]|uniref:MlaD family protein n=1 Tax=Nocardia sp. 348MFTsu5.1 TaxID=1172185 RepID=UPI00035FB2D3|nr:MCE family protein [Nocardia sp. 348MFTsu5.1]